MNNCFCASVKAASVNRFHLRCYNFEKQKSQKLIIVILQKNHFRFSKESFDDPNLFFLVWNNIQIIKGYIIPLLVQWKRSMEVKRS